MAVSRLTSDAPIATPRLRLLPARRRFGRRVTEGPGPIVPANSIAGNALMIVVAIMSFLACITVGAVTLVRDAAYDWQQDVLREVTIQVLPTDGTDLDAETAQAVAIAGEAPGIGTVTALSASENAALLEPWLGSGLDLSELPVPRLIVVTVADPGAVDLDALAGRLEAEVTGASLDDHRVWTGRLQAMAGATVLIGLAVLALVFTAMVLSVVFATRGAMAGNQDIVSVLHFIGAEDGFVASEFQRHFLVLGLKGGLIGAGAAIVVFIMLAVVMATFGDSATADQLSTLFGSFSVGPIGYFGALGVAFAIAILTAVTSRLTVFRYLGAVT